MITRVNAGLLVLTISIGTISMPLQQMLGELKKQNGSLTLHSVGWVTIEEMAKKISFIEVLNPYIQQTTIEENKNEEEGLEPWGLTKEGNE